MKVIDLTHTINCDTPVYPGSERPTLGAVARLGEHGYRETRLSIDSHTGTHIDPPAHLVADGRTLDSFAADAFIGVGLVIDCREVGRGGRIGEDILLRYRERLADCDFLLFCTGWDRFWGSDGYFDGYPTLAPSAAEYIASLGLKGVGFDTASPDLIDDANLTCHNKLFSTGNTVIIENLKGLDELIGADFTLCALPILVEGSDGAPARVVAIVGSPD